MVETTAYVGPASAGPRRRSTGTAGRPAARLRRGLARPDERAGHAAVHERRDRIHVEAGLGEIPPASSHVVDARRLDLDVRRTRPPQLASGTRPRSARRPRSPPTAPSSAGRPPGSRRGRRRRRRRSGRPACSTRNASRSTRPLSAERLMTQLEMITSTASSGSGMCLDLALEELDVRRRRPLPGSRSASASISSVMSRP